MNEIERLRMELDMMQEKLDIDIAKYIREQEEKKRIDFINVRMKVYARKGIDYKNAMKLAKVDYELQN